MRNALAQRRATSLRKRTTDSEDRIWFFLRRRQLGVRFRRQVPVGPFIADFVCLELRLVVEIDGGQHADSTHDRLRDRYFQTNGFRVLRFWSNEVLVQTEAVLQVIGEAVKMPPP